jgi:hypothetical protein
MASRRFPQVALPLQLAAVCYRKRGPESNFSWSTPTAETNGLFPKGDPERHLSHSQSAEMEALEEAGAIGMVEPRHFQLYIHSKGVFWQAGGVQEFVVKAFLLEVDRMVQPHEPERNPTWFCPAEAKKVLLKGREVKYGNELRVVIDRALERIRANRLKLTVAR